MYKKEKKLDFKPLGKAIKKARENKGWTQEYLAGLVDCTARNIMYIENNGQHPSLDIFYQLVTLLDLSVDHYFHGESTVSDTRAGLDMMLNTLAEKELAVLEATASGLKKAREMED